LAQPFIKSYQITLAGTVTKFKSLSALSQEECLIALNNFITKTLASAKNLPARTLNYLQRLRILHYELKHLSKLENALTTGTLAVRKIDNELFLIVESAEGVSYRVGKITDANNVIGELEYATALSKNGATILGELKGVRISVGGKVEIKNFTVYLNKALGKVVVEEAGRHPNWVAIADVSNKVDGLIPHVLKVETNSGSFITKTIKKNGVDVHLEGFQGCHTENALKEYVQTHGGTYEVKNPSAGVGGVYDGQPVIKLNGKEYVKTNGTFVEYETGKWGGTSTFFPKEWSDSRILEEVKHAVENNHGLVPGQAPSGNLMFGFSKDGLIEIRFAFNSNGKGTYYAIKK
jgi:hypothetical protein